MVTSVKLTAMASNPTRIFKAISLVTNGILYSVFIAVVLVFHFSKEDPKEQCGRRFVYEPDNSVQKGVTILYAVIVAFFSFLIGFGFLYFGAKLYAQFRSRAAVLNVKSSQENKVNFFVIGFVADMR